MTVAATAAAFGASAAIVCKAYQEWAARVVCPTLSALRPSEVQLAPAPGWLSMQHEPDRGVTVRLAISF